mgnify:CR=1 FL=1
MTALQRTPQNTNLLQPTKFLLTFDRMPTVQFFCQGVNIPGVSIGQAPLTFPSITAYTPGNQLAYNNFNVDFLVDETATTWQEIYNWFRSFASPDGTDERNVLNNLASQKKFNTKKPYLSDATLTILSALNNPIMRVEFTNCFPLTMNGIDFDTKQDANHIVTCTANFRYQSYKYLTV